MAVDFLGFNLFSGNVVSCAREIVVIARGESRDCKIFLCLNPHSYVLAKNDAEFHSALRQADWLAPDGVGISLAAHWLNIPIESRVTGPDVLLETMAELNRIKGSVFFLGASDETLSRIRRRVSLEYPSVRLAGTFSPPFRDEFSQDDNEAMIAAVNAARPDVLWVGMTAPKQEKWLAQHRGELQVGAAGAIGAAFDFFAGTVKRSPWIFRVIGLEWFPRLIQQPRRLWRRMFISAPKFLADVYLARRVRQKGYPEDDL